MSNFVKDMTLFDDDISYINGLIPDNSKMNFERNLCFLRVLLDKKENKYLAGYSPTDNKLILCKKSIEESKKMNKNTFFNFFKYIIRHELLHVASSKYDKKNNIVYFGFNVEYLNKKDNDKSECFNYFQEGFIDLLLSKDYPETVYKYSLYVNIVDLFTEIVGMDLMKDTFFNSKGITPIKNKLKEYGIEEKQINDFFVSFNNIEYDINQENISTSLPNIQNILLNFYTKKVEKAESKDELIESKFIFTKKLNKLIDSGEELHNKLYMDSSFYRYMTNGIKEKVKSI